MKILCYDFETTGVPDFSAPSDAEHQPHIVQVAAILADSETKETITSIDLIAKPDGWDIPEEVAEIHGITTERAKEVGVEEDDMVRILYDMWQAADVRVGHNESFDARIMRIALKRFGYTEEADVWKAGDSECTCDMAKDICKLPPTEKMLAAGFNSYKKPNLTEAYEMIIGKEMKNAHTAIADVLACMDIYWAIKEA